jgi:hypothetical protein
MAIQQPKVTRRKITDYLPDDHNANLGSERGLQMLESSLNEDGAGRSIVVDAHDKIPAGNKTLEAAVLAGIEDVIEIETDGKALIVHKRTDWDLDDPTGAARRYAYRDNRTSEVSLTWDANVIAADVEAGFDLSHMFHDWEIDSLVGKALTEIDPSHAAELWQGMPEFDNPGEKPFHSLILHFKTEADMKAFAELTSQVVNKTTKYLYYPKQEIDNWAKYQIQSEDEN